MKFLLGIITGAALGLVFAPAPGEQTREELAQKARQWSEVPAQKAAELAQASKQKAGDLGARLGREAAEAAVEAASDKLLGKDKESA
jgi:gas vesicle protein